MNKDIKLQEQLQINSTQSMEEILRLGAKNLLAIAIEAEIQEYIKSHSEIKTPEGQPALVRNGYHEPRKIQTTIGAVEVKVGRTRTRVEGVKNFTSQLIPKYIRKSMALEDALPYFYLAGLSTNDFQPCFEKLFGKETTGLSPTTITRIKSSWSEEMKQWSRRDLSNKTYCYLWVDGIHFNVRIGEERLCVLVVMGADASGKKELVSVEGGYRESTESWRDVLRSLKERGLSDPKLCIGDGALGFWNAVGDVFPTSKQQRCWVHRTANILDKMPKSVQPQAKELIHEMYQAETYQTAFESYERFISRYQDRYPRAISSLNKDSETLFSFYSFPKEHWCHIRSTNVIESTFATVRLRTKKTRGHGTLDATLSMVFKLAERASMKWRKLKGYKLILNVLEGTEFENGELKIAA